MSTYPNPYQPAPKKKTSTFRVVALVLLGLAVLLCGVTVIAVAATSPQPRPPAVAEVPAAPAVEATTQSPAAAPTTPPAARSTPPAAPTTPARPAVPTITDGTWTVGEDFPAGTYKTVGAGDTCYWSITKSGTNGEDIINNHIGGGNLRVTLKAGQDFETKRCGTWQKV